MRIVITGASGNAGTALLRRLQREAAQRPGGLELVGVSRRAPDTAEASRRCMPTTSPTPTGGSLSAGRAEPSTWQPNR